ncbi:hypothetical protein BCR43DRAFT_498454 [Syncephalastrum racemosum]|uniref:Transmembrane protein 198 n=1 Tax=Syncephalastrum racemosum TaxID=13706 RepID=A0A1X2H142_SYNRA|nr:hypothetical protein BCR43DRAFT_498454 [Syncephalastrum racemosum]
MKALLYILVAALCLVTSNVVLLSAAPTATRQRLSNNLVRRYDMAALARRDLPQNWNNGGGSPTSTASGSHETHDCKDDDSDCAGVTSGGSGQDHDNGSSGSSSNNHDSEMAVIYGSDIVTPQLGVAGAIFIVLGIYLMLFGFRSFRMTLVVSGFLTFGLCTWVGMANTQPEGGFINNDITMIVVPVGIGILGSILYAFFWNLTMYLVGGLGGLALGLFILCWREDLVITQNVARACYLVAISVFMACATFFLERYVILFSTSFTGAYIFIVGIDFLVHTGYLAGIKRILDHNPLHEVTYTITGKVKAMLAVTIVLAVLSLGWQSLYNRRRAFGVNVVEAKAPHHSPPPSAAREEGGSHHDSGSGSGGGGEGEGGGHGDHGAAATVAGSHHAEAGSQH